MTYLVVAVVLLAILNLFTLVLTMGIVRRLRTQTPHHEEPPTVIIGQRIGAFHTTDMEGEPIGPQADHRRVTAFFMPDCPGCTQELPHFADFAAGFAGDVVAVVVADEPAKAQPYQEKLAGVARLVMEPRGGAMSTAFAVTSFPAMAVTDVDGRVLANGNAVHDLAEAGARR